MSWRKTVDELGQRFETVAGRGQLPASEGGPYKTVELPSV